MNQFLSKILSNKKVTNKVIILDKDTKLSVEEYNYDGINILFGNVGDYTGQPYYASIDETFSDKPSIYIDQEQTEEASDEEILYFFHYHLGCCKYDEVLKEFNKKFDEELTEKIDLYVIKTIGIDKCLKGIQDFVYRTMLSDDEPELNHEIVTDMNRGLDYLIKLSTKK